MTKSNVSYELKRFSGIKRDYTEKEVERLRGSLKNSLFYLWTTIKKIMDASKYWAIC